MVLITFFGYISNLSGSNPFYSQRPTFLWSSVLNWFVPHALGKVDSCREHHLHMFKISKTQLTTVLGNLQGLTLLKQGLVGLRGLQRCPSASAAYGSVAWANPSHWTIVLVLQSHRTTDKISHSVHL